MDDVLSSAPLFAALDAEASAALTAAGAEHVATVAMTEHAPPMCAYHRTAHGLIVEVVSRALRPVLLPGS